MKKAWIVILAMLILCLCPWSVSAAENEYFVGFDAVDGTFLYNKIDTVWDYSAGAFVQKKYEMKGSEWSGYFKAGQVLGEQMKDKFELVSEPVRNDDSGAVFEGWIVFELIPVTYRDGSEGYAFDYRGMKDTAAILAEIPVYDVCYVAKWSDLPLNEYLTWMIYAFDANGGNLIVEYQEDGVTERCEDPVFEAYVEFGEDLKATLESDYGASFVGVEKEGYAFNGWTVYESDEAYWIDIPAGKVFRPSDYGIDPNRVKSIYFYTEENENGEMVDIYYLFFDTKYVGSRMTTEDVMGLNSNKHYYLLAEWKDEPVSDPVNGFEDVSASAYYGDAVAWALENGITTGITPTIFLPDDSCTRGQIVTFLWRAFGSQEPTLMNNPFYDVDKDQYYTKAVLWALENGITTGTSSTRFDTHALCTRAQIVTFLWRAFGEPEPAITENPFTDVDINDYYGKAVLWAVENGITTGTTSSTFSPNDTCTRGQVVTFLYRTRDFL